MTTPHGALVTEVRPGSPAEKGGVKIGDVITQYAGSTIHDVRQLSAVVARTGLNAKEPVVVLRDGKEVTLEVAMAEMPEGFRTAKRDTDSAESLEHGTSVKSLGVEVAPLTADKADQLGLKVKEGVLIVAVDDDGPAAKAGLQAGMLIERIGQKPVRTVAELESAVKEGSLANGLLLLVRTAEGSRFVVVKE